MNPVPWLAAVCLAVAGCGNLGTPAPRFALFDLGAPAPLDGVSAAVPADIETVAPPWLGSAAMQYRLEYRQPAQRESYSESRWVAPPATMLGHTFDRLLKADGVATSECRLRIEVDEFVQVFDSPHDSRVEVAMRATLLSARTDAPLARTSFSVREPAPSADANGGIIAFRRAIPPLAAQLADWLGALDRASGQGLNTSGRCRR